MQKLHIPKGYQQTKILTSKLKTDDPNQWVESGRRRAFRLFQDMARNVPAYSDFLKKHGIKPASLKSFSNLKYVPSVDKDNYLRIYSKKDLCWRGSFGKGAWVIATTSGSTGQPYYFPRQTSQDWQYAVVAEQYLLSNFAIDKQSTLYVVGFPMGAWIGGVFTYEAIMSVAAKGYDLSVITPGIHKTEIVNAIKQLAGSFDQIIIGAYAPFLKDILEDGVHEGIDWKKLNVKFIFSAEAFSENFRDYLVQKVGLQDVYRDTLNHYGTVDLGTMAHETPLSILIRRRLIDQDSLGKLFPEKYKQPTLCQYNPDLFFFEQKENTLFCSAYSGLPLFRYDLKDYGGVISYKKMDNKLKKLGIDMEAELAAAGLKDTLWRLPFVYVYERNDFSVSYYAFNVYPDPVRKALHSDELRPFLTGKFTMESIYDKRGRQSLLIHAERLRNAQDSQTLNATAVEQVHNMLMKESAEYPELFRLYGEKAKPVIRTYPYEHDPYFKPGTKQKWVVKPTNTQGKDGR